ncbi:hypothetical protein GCM10027275_50020 [Rhabdobacter roseus]|uniref:DUF4138 domain-containing protein n=1 Tax=Rhabdobacter roseus TaxID=1655419 RepID=A0A840TVX2_9BACT|nr:DUF4138 domain-containing protein [Rhabdobacter roseus]MBB5287065.1 hypothetical protein [Rhabdobacter roseus]
MNKKILFLTLAMGLYQGCPAQTYLPDTVKVNRTSTTYLIFPSKVALVDISPEYLIKIESGNIVFVRPRTTSARLTPLLVRTSDETFLGYLKVSDGTPPAFVDISKLQRPVQTEVYTPELPIVSSTGQATIPASVPNGDQLLASLNPTAEGTLIEKQPIYEEESILTAERSLKIRMDSLLSGSPQNFDQERNSGIVVKLTHLLHDSTNTYVQLTIQNQTAMPYLLDQVSFWYQNQARKRKGIYLDGETYPMEPIVETVPDRVEADQKIQLRFALPQFAPQNRSEFVVNIREKSGTRNVTLSLPMKTVLYARPTQPGIRHDKFKKETNKERFSNSTWIWNDWKKKKA